VADQQLNLRQFDLIKSPYNQPRMQKLLERTRCAATVSSVCAVDTPLSHRSMRASR
jgi:hypothetical protein